MKKDGLVYTVVFTFVVCAAFVFFLALANELTKERVAANRRFAERSALLSALGIPFAAPAEVDQLYESRVRTLEGAPVPLYRATVEGKVRIAKPFAGAGLWGTISGILAVEEGVVRIAGFRIVSHNETPGLGGRIDESWFQDQFSGEAIPPEGLSILQGAGTGDADRDNGILDGVTGASRTSAAVQAIVNQEIADLRKLDAQGVLK